MAAKRRYNVKGTKDFIVMAGIFFFLCVWAVFDAWFPSSSVLKKHPRTVDIVSAQSGAMKRLRVSVGDTVAPARGELSASLIAELKTTELDAALDEARAEYRVVKDGGMEDRLKAEKIEQKMARILEKIDQMKIYAPELGNEKDGVIEKLLVDKFSYVESGQVVAVIRPNSHFYNFNISLAIFSFIAFWVFLMVHIFGH